MNLIPLDTFLKKSQLEVTLSDIVSRRIFKPRRDCEIFFLADPIDWEAVAKNRDRNWRMQLQGWAVFFPIMHGFDNSEEKQYLINFFFDVMTDWYQKYGQDPNNIITTRMPKSYAWYDMSAGFRALVIAFFKNRLDYYNLYITDRKKHTLELVINKHISHLSNKEVFSLNNHGMFQIQGLMALIQVKGVSSYVDEYEYALTRMEELVRAQFDNKGIHLEHSPHYHFYALTVFQKIVINNWYDSKPIIKERIAKAISVKKWLVDPLRRTACIGDSTLATQKNIDFTNREFSSALEVQAKKGVLSNFSESGYQIYRSNWDEKPDNSSYLFLMGMYNSKTHKHRDCLSFEWFENGHKVICDSGKYGYVSDNYRSYFLSYKAHNSVEIEGFDILNSEPYGSCLYPARNYLGLIEMSGEINCQDIQHNRCLVIKPGYWVLVFDKLNYLNKRKTTQWFHPSLIYNEARLDGTRAVFNSSQSELIINCL
ncbi:MAG: heparinase II/III family protein, partial [Lactococcus lactis]|nr:heparinase II/III family protein [Lactococcus lactis]